MATPALGSERQLELALPDRSQVAARRGSVPPQGSPPRAGARRHPGGGPGVVDRSETRAPTSSPSSARLSSRVTATLRRGGVARARPAPSASRNGAVTATSSGRAETRAASSPTAEMPAYDASFAVAYLVKPVRGRRRLASARCRVSSADDVLGRDALHPELGPQRQPVRERGNGDRLHVVGRHEVAARRAQPGSARASAGPATRAGWRRPGSTARLARGRDEVDHVAADRLGDVHLPRSRACMASSVVARRRRARARPRPSPRSRRRRAPATRPRASGSRPRSGAGTGRAAPPAADRCPRTRSGSAWRARGTAARAACVTPSIVTCRSCIASSSAACVFGGARLISSPSRRLAKTGPGRNSKSAVALVEDRRAGHVRRHQVGRELDAREARGDGHRRERPRDERLRQAGEVLDQHVTVGEQAEQHQLERVTLADDRASRPRRGCAPRGGRLR